MPINQQNKPNILLIVSDQHRYDCMGAYGNPDIRTPYLDALSEDGVTYKNSFCSSPFCTPSRYSLLTGLYPHQHLGWGNLSTIPSGIATFPKLLQLAGYRTKAVGKMHLTPTYLDVGFDDMILAEQNGDGRYEDDYHRYLMEQGLLDRLDLMDQVKEYREKAPPSYWDTFGTEASNLSEEHHSTTWIGNQALTAIENWGTHNEMLMVSFIKPHHPFDPPVPWSSMYNPAELHLLPGWTDQPLERDLRMHPGFFEHTRLTEEKLRRTMTHYYGAISHIDHMTGQFVEALKRKGIYDNTLVIYTSDHGEYMGYHHMLLKSNYMYEPLAKVPLLVKYPGGVNAGECSDQLINNIDISTTILAAAGVNKDKSMVGINLMSSEEQGREFIIGEDSRGRQYMVRSERYKLILTRDHSKCVFFDLQNDPLELNNLIDDPDYEEHITRCRHALQQTLLFDAPSPSYLDRNAPIITGNRVPNDSTVRKRVSEWIAGNWNTEDGFVDKNRELR
ncbi:sulfatase-like hydrolase/transferase [Paenibacillus sp. ATY16]|nr:sulfatase-like hydrolase/transferase [Paenibacillus sp. ATY16]